MFKQVQEGVQAVNDASASSSEAERVRKLRERVEAQEAKLRKLRALRGQVDQQRITNGSLCKRLARKKKIYFLIVVMIASF
jgi:methionine salvage enolase-phosphatase E1